MSPRRSRARLSRPDPGALAGPARARGAWAIALLGLLLGAEPAQAERSREPTVIGLDFYVVAQSGELVVDRAWLENQLQHANLLFAAAGVQFENASHHRIGAGWAHIDSRDRRDALGRCHQRIAGRVPVFVVRQLDDVDIADHRLHGVHWRDSGDRRQTWIILSTRDDSATVLAHELGHRFGLPHSRYAASIMNKTARERPAWPQRVFVAAELAIIGRTRDRLLRSGQLARYRATPASAEAASVTSMLSRPACRPSQAASEVTR